MIELKNIEFSYREKKIINGVDITLKKGEICALIGKNGCGKTTLVNILSRRIKPKNGSFLLDGKNSEEYSPRDFASLVASFPQSRPTPNMSVYDYVSYGRYPYAGALFRLTDEDRAIIGRALETTGTADFAERNVSSLSGGERQLVYLAMLAAQDAEHLILDEPTAFMDAANCFCVTDILRDFAEAGKGVFAVMHDIPHALGAFSRVAVMKDGKIIFDGEPRAAVESGAVESAFGVLCEPVGDRDYVLRRKLC